MENKFFKFNSVVLSALFAFVLVSCTDEYEYEAAPVPNNAGITLSTEDTDFYFEGTQDKQSFTFFVNRPENSKDNAVTVSLVCDNEKVQLPETVSFAIGETSKEITANCSLEKGDKITVSISASEKDANVYSENQYIIVTLERDRYAWLTCGKAIFTDFNFGAGDEDEWVEVEVQRCEGEDVVNTYKLVQPFTMLYGEGSGDVKFEINANGTIKEIITDGGVIATLAGYDFYFDPVGYGAYCNFEKDAEGYYIINHLLKKGSSLYVGSGFVFQWTEGYPF